MTPARAACALLALLLPAGCQAERACTAIGCADGATIEITRADGMVQAMAAELQVDGRAVSCPSPPADAGGSACSDAGLRITRVALQDCEEVRSGSSVGQSCTPNGRHALLISLPGTPSNVAVTLRQGDTTVAQRSFALSYSEARPNGAGCEPLCRQATARWTLP